MKPILTHSEYLSHKDRDLEVRGEVFDSPIKKNDSVELHTVVSVMENGELVYEDGQPIRYFFLNKLTEPELIKTVNGIKNEEKFLP